MKQKTTPAKPTTAQLALLAATLVTSKERPDPIDHLVKKALRIWEAAQKLLLTPPPDLPPSPPALPKPKRYPVTLDNFLGIMLPRQSGRRGDKYHIFRNYLRFLRHEASNREFRVRPSDAFTPVGRILRNSCSPHPFAQRAPQENSATGEPPSSEKPIDGEDVDELFNYWKTHSIPDSASYYYHAHWFNKWYDEVHDRELSAIRRAVGAKGRASPKRKSKEAKLTVVNPAPSK